ncbi:MAG: hypothetical protein FWG03_01275 [Clostridiales bacterium]|nr:hypothetical protein [Clostridiales bacterium]
MLAGIKYCGGCRASYDRRAEADRVIAASGGFQGAAPVEGEDCGQGAAPVEGEDGGRQGVVAVNAEEGGSYDVLVVVCGCKARCPDISRYHYKSTVYIDGPGSDVKL